MGNNPFTGIGDINYDQTKRSILTVEELNTLLQPENFPSKLAYQMFRFTAYTGMRLREVLTVHWEQLDGDVLSIDRAWVAPYELGLPKWGKKRIIPLPASVMNNLPPVNPERTDLVFQQDNARLGNTWWIKNFKSAVKKTGLDTTITAHYLRHTINSHLLVNA